MNVFVKELLGVYLFVDDNKYILNKYEIFILSNRAWIYHKAINMRYLVRIEHSIIGLIRLNIDFVSYPARGGRMAKYIRQD